MSCSQFQQLPPHLRSADDAALLSLSGRNKWRQCPACSHVVECSQGCNHIKCVCGCSFCFFTRATPSTQTLERQHATCTARRRAPARSLTSPRKQRQQASSSNNSCLVPWHSLALLPWHCPALPRWYSLLLVRGGVAGGSPAADAGTRPPSTTALMAARGGGSGTTKTMRSSSCSCSFENQSNQSALVKRRISRILCTGNVLKNGAEQLSRLAPTHPSARY